MPFRAKSSADRPRIGARHNGSGTLGLRVQPFFLSPDTMLRQFSSAILPLGTDAVSNIPAMLAAYRAYCAESRTYSGVGRPARAISSSDEDSTIAAVTSGLIRATGLSATALGGVDGRIYLLDLPRHAEEHARSAGHAKPTNYSRLARGFVEALLGTPVSARTKVPERFLSEPWRALLPLYLELGMQQSHLVTLARCCAHRQILTAPAVLPEVDDVLAAMSELGLKTSYGSNVTSSYRRARSELLARDPTLAANYADIPVKLGRRTEGLLTMDELRVLCPELVGQYEHYVAEGLRQKRLPGEPDRPVSHDWLNTARDATLHFGTALVCAHEQLHQESPQIPALRYCMWEDLLTSTAVVRTVGDGKRYVPQSARGAASKSSTEEITVLEYLLRRMAPAYRARTVRAGHAGYPATLHRMMQAIGSIIYCAWGMNPDALIVARYKALEKNVRKNLMSTNIADKRLLLQHISLPLLQCVLLPVYQRYYEEPLWQVFRRAVSDALRAGHDPRTHRGVQRAKKEWAECNQRYVVTAFAVEDGMREKQYRNGLLDKHIMLKRDGTGALTEIETSWWGDRNDPAGVKVDLKQNVVQRSLNRPISPGVVHLPAVERYVTNTREDHVSRHGLADGKMLSFFVSPKSPRDAGARDPRQFAVGSYSKNGISQIIGDTIYFLVAEVLGAPVPPRDELTEEWRGLFAGHYLRSLIATFFLTAAKDVDFGGMTGEQYACFKTMDDLGTLERDYAEEISWLVPRLLSLRDSNSHENPRAYLPWMLAKVRANAQCPLDDPELPLPPRVAALIAKHEQQAKLCAWRGRVPGQKNVRRPRPGQKVSGVGG